MWHDPYFYILISFVLFLFFMGYPLYKKLLQHLQIRSSTIERQITEVEALYLEAQSILLEQKNALVLSKKAMSVLEKEAHIRVKKIQEETKNVLMHFEEISKKDLEREISSLKEDCKHSIQRELMERSYINIQWILKNKLTEAQKEKLISFSMEKV